VAEQQLESHTVTAYMEAVTSTASIVLDTETVEDAMFVGQVVRESQANALTTLADLLVQRNELERIEQSTPIELVQVESIEQQLARTRRRAAVTLAEANQRWLPPSHWPPRPTPPIGPHSTRSTGRSPRRTQPDGRRR
jgi:hypothetical protein